MKNPTVTYGPRIRVAIPQLLMSFVSHEPLPMNPRWTPIEALPEENLPQVLFDTGKVQVAYRGREWLQRLLNTLGDDRGRNPVQDALSKTGGTWLYMFPTLQGHLPKWFQCRMVDVSMLQGLRLNFQEPGKLMLSTLTCTRTLFPLSYRLQIRL